mgnify:CR=1 FL=1
MAEMAGFFGLEPLLHRKTDELSGGQKQTVNLAAVLMLQPQVLHRELLKDGEIVTDARNLALHDVAESQIAYRRAVVEAVPPAFLVN